MSVKLSTASLTALNGCDIAKSLTGQVPEPGTTCWVYNMDDSGRLHKKCEKCPYLLEMQAPCNVTFSDKGGIGVITITGNVSETALPTLKKIADSSVSSEKALAVDCSGVTAMCSPSLGLLLRLYKARKEKSSPFFLVAPSTGLLELLRSTMLIKVMPVVRDFTEVENAINKLAEDIKTGELRRKQEEEKKKLEEAATLRCWEYYKGQHPKNATPCAVCYYKASNSKNPCWVIIGNIDGVEFDYVDEDCLDCQYYLKLNPDADVIQI
ncbi:MAG: STAS domain-containing protein [Fibrobacteres bacterium]|nr:STAS domain-containing protein [Fibrobacterota bacterium]